MSAFRVSALMAALYLSVSCVGALAASVTFPSLGRNVVTGTLPSGGRFIVSHRDGVPVAAIELWYRAPSIGFEVTPIPSLAHLAAEVVVASKPIKGQSLSGLISDLGGRIVINTYADSIAISAVVPAWAASRIVKAMTTSFFAPVVTDEGYRDAQHEVAQQALLQSFNPDDSTRNAVFSSLFRAGPAHYPVLGGVQAIADISLAEVTSFASRAFRSQNALVVVAGDVDPSVADAVVVGRASMGTAADTNPKSEFPMSSALATSPQFIRQVGDELGGAYAWVGPPITDERAATAMDFIADYLFRSDGGVVVRELAGLDPNASASGQFITLHDPGVFFVSFTGKKPGNVKAAVDAGLGMMRKPLAQAVFAAAIDAFEYHLLSDLQTPLGVADNFGWYTVEGNPAYAPGADEDRGEYFHAMHSLTPAFIAQVARKYLDKPAVTIVVVPAKPGTQRKKELSS